MGMYNQFETDRDLEQNGVVLDYGDFRVTVARPGGANKAFDRAVEARVKPIRRAIQAEAVPKDQIVKIAREAFVETCVKNWEVKTGEENGQPVYTQGIEQRDGTIVPFSKEAVNQAFIALPALAEDIQEQAAKLALWRAAALEDEAKN